MTVISQCHTGIWQWKRNEMNFDVNSCLFSLNLMQDLVVGNLLVLCIHSLICLTCAPCRHADLGMIEETQENTEIVRHHNKVSIVMLRQYWRRANTKIVHQQLL